MKEKGFIIAEVKKHLSASAKKSKYEVIEATKNMPTFEGLMLPYYVSTMEGAKYPVDVEHIYCDEYNEFYNLMVVQVAERILQDKKYKDA
jgi:hypothetical protein|nr:MAG TPA: hypothetical protein [Caudoviricetes sp.]